MATRQCVVLGCRSFMRDEGLLRRAERAEALSSQRSIEQKDRWSQLDGSGT